jgi:hypothetical protein
VTRLFSGPIDIRESPNDTLYVNDYKAQSTGAIIAVDPSTGGQRLVAAGGSIKWVAGSSLTNEGQVKPCPGSHGRKKPGFSGDRVQDSLSIRSSEYS